MGDSLRTAHDLVAALQVAADPDEVKRIRPRVAPDEPVIGVRMRTLFDTSKSATHLPPSELEQLFTHPAYEPRLAAFCILDFRARGRRTVEERVGLATVYLDHHDASPKPFRWTADADLILDRVKKVFERIADS